jgi:hypothetical protein
MDLELRGALRSLTRSPGYLVTVVLSLALGLGAAASARCLCAGAPRRAGQPGYRPQVGLKEGMAVATGTWQLSGAGRSRSKRAWKKRRYLGS